MNKKFLTTLILLTFCATPICWAGEIIVGADGQARYANQETPIKEVQTPTRNTQTPVKSVPTQQKNNQTPVKQTQNKTSEVNVAKTNNNLAKVQIDAARAKELAEYDKINYKASTFNMDLAQAVSIYYDVYAENDLDVMKNYENNKLKLEKVREGIFDDYYPKYGNYRHPETYREKDIYDSLKAKNYNDDIIRASLCKSQYGKFIIADATEQFTPENEEYYKFDIVLMMAKNGFSDQAIESVAFRATNDKIMYNRLREIINNNAISMQDKTKQLLKIAVEDNETVREEDKVRFKGVQGTVNKLIDEGVITFSGYSLNLYKNLELYKLYKSPKYQGFREQDINFLDDHYCLKQQTYEKEYSEALNKVIQDSSIKMKDRPVFAYALLQRRIALTYKNNDSELGRKAVEIGLAPNYYNDLDNWQINMIQDYDLMKNQLRYNGTEIKAKLDYKYFEKNNEAITSIYLDKLNNAKNIMGSSVISSNKKIVQNAKKTHQFKQKDIVSKVDTSEKQQYATISLQDGDYVLWKPTNKSTQIATEYYSDGNIMGFVVIDVVSSDKVVFYEYRVPSKANLSGKLENIMISSKGNKYIYTSAGNLRAALINKVLYTDDLKLPKLVTNMEKEHSWLYEKIDNVFRDNIFFDNKGTDGHSTAGSIVMASAYTGIGFFIVAPIMLVLGVLTYVVAAPAALVAKMSDAMASKNNNYIIDALR